MAQAGSAEYVIAFEQLRNDDVGKVGGKNASLGEMIGGLAQAGIRVPGGFATTADAYRDFLAHSGLDKRISARLANLDTNDVEALARCGTEIRGWIEATRFPAAFEGDIKSFYQELSASSSSEMSFAVRSSATAEDLPDQKSTRLNSSHERLSRMPSSA